MKAQMELQTNAFLNITAIYSRFGGPDRWRKREEKESEKRGRGRAV
jgi:hypothetical protein